MMQGNVDRIHLVNENRDLTYAEIEKLFDHDKTKTVKLVAGETMEVYFKLPVPIGTIMVLPVDMSVDPGFSIDWFLVFTNKGDGPSTSQPVYPWDFIYLVTITNVNNVPTPVDVDINELYFVQCGFWW